MTEDADEYRRVFGVKFYQPDDPSDLNYTSIQNDPGLVVIVFLSVIPMLGFWVSTATMSVGFASRETNSYRIDEHFWKAGVVGLLMQVFSLIGMGIFLLH